MLQIYKISKASSGGGRLCLDPPEGKILWRQNNSFAPLSHSLPLTTCQSHKSQVLLPSCSFLGTIFMVAVGQAALLPWCQPTQLLGESTGCAEPEQGAQPALRQSRGCRTACLGSLQQLLALSHPPLHSEAVARQLWHWHRGSQRAECRAGPLLQGQQPLSSQRPGRLEHDTQCQPQVPVQAVLSSRKSHRHQTTRAHASSTPLLLQLPAALLKIAFLQVSHLTVPNASETQWGPSATPLR